jgi:predicted flap endonuclease-1-like 5' DNA nuclease
MVYLITQILLSLMFTAALALIAGWLLRGIGIRAQLDALARERERERERANALAARLSATAVPPAGTPVVTAVHRVEPPVPDTNAHEALAALRDRLGQLDAVARTQAERIAELGTRLREKDQLLDGLQRRAGARAPAPDRVASVPRETPRGLLAERPAQIDRLQAISGIGPVLERVLNELGIYRFGQLARLTPDHIEWLASRIDWFPQRIQREDWVGQARRLHDEMHPDEEL